MAKDGSIQDNVRSLSKFYVNVKLGSQDCTVSCQDISGLNMETQAIEYRHGDSKQFSTINIPGIAKKRTVMLKKCAFVKDNNFFKWYDGIKMNTIKRETVTIQLLDESGNPTMTWKLINAWPIKIISLDLKSDANEVAVISIELAHEGVTIANA